MYLIFWNTDEKGWNEFLGTWSGELDFSDGDWRFEDVTLPEQLMLGKTFTANVLYDYFGRACAAYIPAGAQWKEPQNV